MTVVCCHEIETINWKSMAVTSVYIKEIMYTYLLEFFDKTERTNTNIYENVN